MCADPGAMTPIGASGNFSSCSLFLGTVIQNPRRCCCRVSNFVKRIKFGPQTPSPLDGDFFLF